MFRHGRNARVEESEQPDGYVDLGAPPPRSLRRLVLGVWLGSLAIIVAVAVLHVSIMQSRLRHHETQRAVDDVRERVDLVIEETVTPALLAGDPAAIAAYDDLMQDHVVRHTTAGLALWRPDGTVVWALDGNYIGKQYELPNEAAKALKSGEVQATNGEAGDKDTALGWKPESAIEVYAPFVTKPGGEPLVWEAGLRREQVSKDADRLVLVAAALLGLGAAVLLTAQGILGSTLVRRNDREREYRRWLTQRVSEMAAVERRQIAADLHDGVVQELAGIALDLEAPVPGSDGTMATSERKRFAARVRGTVATLRGQTAELYPSAAALIDVPTALQSMLDRMPRGIDKQLTVDPAAAVEPGYRWLVFRVAQEALRNVTQHSKARTVIVALHHTDAGTVLTVTDDGKGFVPETDAVEPGHMGLSLMSDTANAAGAHLTIRSVKGEGTTIRLEVPE
jgi:signal transduction histidine kinase